jgi:hypothetical protein
MSSRSSRRAILLGIPAVLAATTVAAGIFSRSVPDDLDLSLERRTDAGLYVATIAPVDQGVTVGSLHSWTVALTDADGRPVEAAHRCRRRHAPARPRPAGSSSPKGELTAKDLVIVQRTMRYGSCIDHLYVRGERGSAVQDFRSAACPAKWVWLIGLTRCLTFQRPDRLS